MLNWTATVRRLDVLTACACLALHGLAGAQSPPPETPRAASPIDQLFARMRPTVESIDGARIQAMGRQSGLTTCFWVGTVSPDTFNILFPDSGVTYWIAQFTLPAGARLDLQGEFPHARHMSFNVYDANGQPLDRLNDQLIDPVDGGVNPFRVGAARAAAQRAYGVRVMTRALRAGAPVDDATRAQNTVYAGQDGNVVQLWYRIYVPDAGRDAKGGATLPSPTLVRADGSTVSGPELCREIVKTDGAVRDIRVPAAVVQEALALPGRSPAQPAQAEPKWDAFFNAGLSASRLLIGTEHETMRDKQDATRRGGFYSTLDNTYMSMYVDNRLGRVLTMQGKAPTTPRTRAGAATMEAADLRYWSVCKYRSLADTAMDACLYDEQVPLDANRRFTIVMSKPEDRPANARPECGVAWMPWGIGDGILNPHGGYLVWRQMMPSPEHAPHSIFATRKLHEEAAVLGEHYPQPRYTSRAEFEARGCAK